MRLLLIEDDSVFGDGLREGLRQAGYAVDWLTDGQLAASALHGDDFDAVVLDLALPGRSGLELLATWRDAGKAVPVLILTASDGVDAAQQGAAAGICSDRGSVRIGRTLRATDSLTASSIVSRKTWTSAGRGGATPRRPAKQCQVVSTVEREDSLIEFSVPSARTVGPVGLLFRSSQKPLKFALSPIH